MAYVLVAARAMCVALILATAGCTRFFFMPQHELVRAPTDIGLTYDDVFFQSTDDVRLHAWWLPAEGKARGTVIFFHGNAQNISNHIASVYWLPEAGYNVFMPDYRGYGLSEGEPSLQGIIDDAAAAIKTVMERPDVDTSRVVVLGQSLGGATAIYTVAHSPYHARIKALIADSTFASHRRITREKLGSLWLTWLFQWPAALTVSDAFSPVRAIPAVAPTPVLIIHGTADQIIPIEHARRLFAAAREPKQLWEIPNAIHIQSLTIPEVRQRLVAFMQNAITR